MSNSFHEVIFNFWAVFNPYHQYFESILGKAYWIAGTDDEKINFLSEKVNDCDNEDKYRISDKFRCPNRDGKIVSGALHVIEFQMRGLFVFKEIIDKVEMGEIEIVDRLGKKQSFNEITISEEPLCIITPLMQKIDGRYKPITDELDRKWANDWESFIGEP